MYYIEKVTGGRDVVVCNAENEFSKNIVAGGGKGRRGKAETVRFIIIRASSHPSTRRLVVCRREPPVMRKTPSPAKPTGYGGGITGRDCKLYTLDVHAIYIHAQNVYDIYINIYMLSLQIKRHRQRDVGL